MSVLLTLLAFTAAAADPASQPAPAVAKPQAEKKICKVDPLETESRIRKRICKTESEWNEGSAKAGAKHSAPRD